MPHGVRRRQGLVLAAVATASASVVAALAMSLWALCVMPFALVVAFGGWNGPDIR